jgi:hypothetical protein
MKRLVTAIGGFLMLLGPLPGFAAQFGVARSAAPVLNTSAIAGVFGGADGRTLKTDHCGQVRALEFIALPGTSFRLLDLLQRKGSDVYRVETDDYPAPAGTALYVDSRFIRVLAEQPIPRRRSLPRREAVIAAMRAAVGSPYVWGGNLRQGVKELLGLYYRGGFSAVNEKRLTLAGLDCSGLLYEATDGWTPRNTSVLVSYGRGIPVAGRSASELAGLLEPLDLITWNGHVIIVLDGETAIESRLECGRPGNGGVVLTPLRQRLAEIMHTRKPVDVWPAGSKQRDVFVVRRWYAP